MTKPSPLFSKVIEKYLSPYFYKIPQPNLYTEYDINFTDLADNQDEFYAKLEQWIIDNEKMIVTYLKQKSQQELDLAQEKFDFTKDL